MPKDVCFSMRVFIPVYLAMLLLILWPGQAQAAAPWQTLPPAAERLESSELSRVALLAGSVPLSSATQSGWRWLGPQDGLMDETVLSLAATSNGGMLIGTSAGMNQWDGRVLREYSSGNGLAHGKIVAVFDSGRSIWAGSWGGGLSALTGSTWEHWRQADSPLPSDWISALAGDGEVLWIGTYGGGVARLEGQDWQVFDKGNSCLPSSFVTCLAPDGLGGIWVGTEAGDLVHLDAQGRCPSPQPSAPKIGSLTALLVQGQHIWVGGTQGLQLYSSDQHVWQRFAQKDRLPSEHITALADTPAGIWVGTPQGLVRYGDGFCEVLTVQDGLPHDYISALAGAHGQLWLGTSVRGAAIQGTVTLPDIPRLPVVLVHGWRGPDSDRLEDSEFWHLARWLTNDGFPVYYATGISPEQPLAANAARLADEIMNARRIYASDQVYLIGFSMGGINARAYLETSLYRGDVARTFLMGSPHLGENLWQTLLLWEKLAWTDEPSATELLPIHMNLFNTSHAQPSVPYVLLAGDARQGDLPLLFEELAASDGLVSTWSALGPTNLVAEKRVTADLHAWSQESLLLDIPSLLFPQSTYLAHIRPYLFGVNQMTGTGAGTVADAYDPIEPSPRSTLRTGSLFPGESRVLREFTVDSSGRVRFYLRWHGAPVQVKLRAPDGQVWDSDTAPGGESVEYLELSYADFASYVVTATQPGSWDLIAELASDVDQETQYVAYAEFPNSALSLDLASDKAWYRIGETVQLTATLEGQALPPDAVEMRAQVYGPSGGRQMVRFESTSLAPRVSGTQVWSGSFVSSETGYWTVLLEAWADKVTGQPFDRGAQLTLGTMGTQASLSHVEIRPKQGEDPNEPFTLTLAVAADRASDYLIFLTLWGQDQQVVASLAHPLSLEDGQYTVTFNLPLKDAQTSGSAGCPTGRVLLLDVSGPSVLLDVMDLPADLDLGMP